MSTELDHLTARLHRARRALDTDIGEARHIARTGARLVTETAELRASVALHERAAAVLTTISEDRQNAAQHQIESLVTLGLTAVFGPGLSFHLVGGVRAKTPVVDFVVRSHAGDQLVDTPVMDARGGGLAATVGFLLRLVVLLLSTPRDSVLLLDETFAHVSAEYEPALAGFIRELVDRTGVQIILVTHSDAYSEVADAKYRFTLRDGRTMATAV